MDMIKQYFHNSGFDGKVYLLDPGDTSNFQMILQQKLR